MKEHAHSWAGWSEAFQIFARYDAGNEHYDEVAASIMEVRREEGLIRSWEEIEGLDGVSAEVLSVLRSDAQLGGFSVLRSDNVGPQIGGETARRGVLAMVFSLVGMLAYIWIRFELRFGLGALVALLHDVVIALGLFVAFDYEADEVDEELIV